MNQHPPASTWLAYLDGALKPLQQSDVERHLADCPACRTDLAARRVLRERLEDLAVDTSAYASSAVTERAWAAVRPRFNVRRNTFFRPLRRLVFGLGATALLAFFVLSLWALFVQQAGPLRTGEQPEEAAALPSPTLASTAEFTMTVNQIVSYDTAYQETAGDLVPVLFTIELYNSGPDVAARVRLTATLPALLTYLERTVGGDAVYDPATHTVIWAGSLAPGAMHTISFACGVPQSVGGPGTTATNRVTIDDGVHALFTDTLTVNFTPWPTIVPTPGPPRTRTPWLTPTPSATPTLDGTPSPTPTPWSGILTPSSSSATPTPWSGTLTPTSPSSTPGAAPTATVTPPVPPPPTLPATPTPLFTPTPGTPPSATATPPVPPPPTLPATPTPWFTPTPIGPPNVTPTPWFTPTPGPPSATPTPWPTSTTSTSTSPPPTPPTPWPTPTPPPF
jgi:uncharacterized repeat protein (TIGR01451 family)